MKVSIRICQSLLLFLTAGILYSGKPYEDRPYEPMVILGSDIQPVKGIPVNEIFVYAYREGAWAMIPFQIDERAKLPDPDLAKGENERERHFYIIANINPDYVQPDTLPGFDGDDELVFMIRDLGDKAPDHDWIDNAEARANHRCELEITDPLSGESAYAYIYRSGTLVMPADVADRYAMQFDPGTHTVQSLAYSMTINQQDGLISDILIRPPYGSGQDIFDTQKLRLNGYVDWSGLQLTWGRDDANSATEQILMQFDNDTYLAYTDQPVVRIIREVRMGIGLGAPLEGAEFYITTKNYPFSGTSEGGTVLDPDSIREALDEPSMQLVIEVDYLRQSWDFNENATGMKFFNPHNSEVSIDGQTDQINTEVDITTGERLRVWTMATGNQGTMFNLFDFAESNWDDVSLYYFDNQDGGQADQDILIADDSGDYISYGDSGLRFFNTRHDKPVNLDFSFTSYLLGANQNQTFAETLYGQLLSSVNLTARSEEIDLSKINEIASPEQFGLSQNYPNPFNSTTRIQFILDRPSDIRLTVFDAAGRRVGRIDQYSVEAGHHTVIWKAADDLGKRLQSGLYLVRLETEHWQDQKKILLLK
ncbi:T9SS type A sorting domain-containing protein [bacterium]|nr:T9SS type A sorting domain-containing protein [bacterium]